MKPARGSGGLCDVQATGAFPDFRCGEPEWREGQSVQPHDRSMRLDGCAMAHGRVAHVDLEPVARIAIAGARHDPVAHDLGNDGSRSDRLRTLVTLDERTAKAGQA